MAISISPLELQLDQQNPRFLILENGTQDKIREYMANYEDACKLASDIDQNRGLFLGERIVVLREGNGYVVMEGNRRTCALQFLLNRNLIPERSRNSVPTVHQETLANISEIEADVAPTRDYAIALMANRHIEGVSQWKPLAKNQFFSNMFDAGNSVTDLNRKTGIETSKIKRHIREYKLMLRASRLYRDAHPEYTNNILDYKITTFHRLFSSKIQVGITEVSPVDFLKIHYDENYNTISDLDNEVFNRILRETFQATIVEENINTRQKLIDVDSISDLVRTLCEDYLGTDIRGDDEPEDDGATDGGTPTDDDTQGGGTQGGGTQGGGTQGGGTQGGGTQGGGTQGGGTQGGGTQGGGPTLGNFFESVNWTNLDIQNTIHAGLIVVLEELRKLSTRNTYFTGQNRKLYYYTPISAGMLMRTAYEQALKVQVMTTNNWNAYTQTLNGVRPMLSNMETYVSQNTPTVLTTQRMQNAYNRIQRYRDRDFLNYNVHDPGRIRITAPALESMASGGLVAFIQEVIDNV